MRLHIQEFLRGGGGFDDLVSRYGIAAKRHGEFPNLVLFKYNQIESPFAEAIVRECRGIILDEAREWAVVSRAFDKFFNHGEGHAAAIDWTTARVQEKVDGSLCTVYEYAGRWHVATTGTPDASGDINGAGRFADYFWRTFNEAGTMPDPADADARDHSFMFELTGPANRIVVVHDAPNVTLLGARCRSTGAEVDPQTASNFFGCRVPVVREFDLAGIDGILASFATLSPLSQEGYVIVDDAFNRIKVKHPGYVALHHAKDGLSTKAFVEIARSGEVSEVLTAFPEFRPLLDDASQRLDSLVTGVEADLERLRGIAEQKAFALEAVKTRCPAALFNVRSGKAPSVRGYFAKAQIGGLMELLGYRGEAAA